MRSASLSLSLSSLITISLLACQLTKKDDAESQLDESTSDSSTTTGGDGDESGSSGVGDGDADAATGEDEKEPIKEEQKGQRGSSCDSASDCEDGLSCIVTDNCPAGVACANKSCQPSNFDIIGTGKQCQLKECESELDCCGELPTEAPEKCAGRENICFRPSAPGCVVQACTEDAECGGGRCTGICTYDQEDCTVPTDCAPNTCVFAAGSGGSGSGGNASGGDSSGGSGNTTGTCSLTGQTCISDANCSTNSCSSVYCRCENPDYDPEDPICEDEDCEGICGFTCEGERCVVDTSCSVDEDCISQVAPYCDEGACVECKTNDDCDDEECIGGHCGPVCESDTECGLFESCKNNECVYVGCQTDRECILSAVSSEGQDPRLFECFVEDGIGTCRFPCEIDAQCPTTQVCLDGLCEYIGCETDAECKTIAGLHNQPLPTEERPWSITARCVDDSMGRAESNSSTTGSDTAGE